MGSLANSNLRSLNLSNNRNITARGCQSLAALLVNPKCNLEELDLNDNRIGDEGALIFANAMASNRKLKRLNLYGTVITAEGWSGFSKVLCDASSINNTFLSNHTLGSFMANPPSDIRSLLALNRRFADKKQVAMEKILKHHQHFDMQPFFEWDLKVLPLFIDWFERATIVRRPSTAHKQNIRKRKLDAIYQFIHAMPEVFETVLLVWQ